MEWNDHHLDPRVRAITLLAAWYSWEKFKKVAVVTHILRSREEQIRFYKGDKEKRSTHEFRRAVDLRSSIYTEEEITELVDYLNKSFPRTRFKTVLYHSVGLGWHFHIQVSPEPVPG